MHFLIDANMPRSAAALIGGYGHTWTDVRDIGMRRATDAAIAQYAQDRGLCIVTQDRDFGDVRRFPPADYRGIVVIGVPGTAAPTEILDVLKVLFDQPNTIAQLPGRLAVVERNKIRLRPAP
jgi:hypothetical protein